MISPEAFSQHYKNFKVSERILLTGHSHQAWPDVAREGLLECFDDAALHVDDKWGRAFAKAEAVQAGFLKLMNDSSGAIQLFANTHDAIVRLLSALPFQKKKEIITTTGEFHTLRRQLSRLSEESFEITLVETEPVATLAERMANRVSGKTLAVFCSAVLFETAQIVPELKFLAEFCEKKSVPLVVDAYHAINVVPFEINQLGLQSAFVVGGGYKYCQLGEGNCFLRYPKSQKFRPILTGWFANFSDLAKPKTVGPTGYDDAAPFAGSTYDPSSHYRAARVFEFFREQKLTPQILRVISQRQIKFLADGFDALKLPSNVIRRTDVAIENLGGFLSLVTPHAQKIHDALKAKNVWTDYRGVYLRLGPAPYITDEQLSDGLELLSDVCKKI